MIDPNGEKIVGIRHWLINMPFVSAHVSASSKRASTTRLVVEVTTESGHKGYGETICLLDFIEPVLVNVVMPIAMGKKVSAIEEIYRHVLGAGYYHHKRAAIMAICAVEMAMWDALGKISSMSLSSLWGGRWRERVAIAGYLLIQDAAKLKDAATALRHKGFGQYKVKIGSGADNDIRLAQAARLALGDNVHLRLDVNGAWTRTTAKRQLDRLRELDIAYVEQPLEMDDLDGLSALRRTQPIPIALDESVYTLQDLVNAIHADAADVVLLDAHEAGGLWQARKSAAIAEGFGIEVGLHSGGELGLSQAANLHLAASIPDMRLAIDSMYGDFADDILTSPLAVVDGTMAVPTGPGLGVEPDLDKLERYRTDAVRGAYLDDSRPGWFPMKPAY